MSFFPFLTNKKIKITTALILIFVSVLFLFFFCRRSLTLKGEVININLESRELTLNSQGKTITLKPTETVKIINNQNIPLAFSEIIKGFVIKAKGRYENQIFKADWIKIQQAPELIIDEPHPNQKIEDNLIVISGRAKTGTKEVYLELKDKNGHTLLTDKIEKQIAEPVAYLEFSKKINLPVNCPSSFYLEIYQKEIGSDKISNKITIPLTK